MQNIKSTYWVCTNNELLLELDWKKVCLMTGVAYRHYCYCKKISPNAMAHYPSPVQKWHAKSWAAKSGGHPWLEEGTKIWGEYAESKCREARKPKARAVWGTIDLEGWAEHKKGQEASWPGIWEIKSVRLGSQRLRSNVGSMGKLGWVAKESARELVETQAKCKAAWVQDGALLPGYFLFQLRVFYRKG